ncbi:histidinol-phosphatase [Marinilabilia rubra]|uniref:Histidinol-phosphatase n=2 Tax=Marinilabilia rubra TaxID=2162893 RepID=A0A2U2BCW4_9BACT|nr:histidinol-phosphatase [Marinilabilia rubra]
MLKTFRADLHVHTVLSPCGNLDMSPGRIINEALKKNIDILAVTDHNSTRQCRVVMELGRQKGITVWGGAEINTREEVHCLALFDEMNAIDEFQKWLDKWLIKVPNNPDYFGDQVWVDAEDNILGEEERLLIAALDRNLDESYQLVKSLGGLFIPAHIDRKSNSLSSQLGFVPPDIQADALEISPKAEPALVDKMGWGKIKPLVAGSDAHWPEKLGSHLTLLTIKDTKLEEFKRALNGESGRSVMPELLKNKGG